MPLDINAIVAETWGKNFEIFEEHVDLVFVKVLRTLGFNRTWVRGEGAYLWDEAGTQYLDFLTTGASSILAGATPPFEEHCNRY
jgi:ornithine--oxo-acid transaminase